MITQFFEGDTQAYVLFGESNRRYLTKLDTSFGCVVLTATASHFITDFRYKTATEAALPNWKLHFVASAELYSTIREIVKNAGVKVVGVEFDVLTYNEYKLLGDALENTTLLACDTLFIKERAVKTDEEIEFIAQSQAINESALAKVFGFMKPKMTEHDLYAEYVHQALKLGAEGMAFEPIIASGRHTAEPHHKTSTDVIMHSDAVLMDVGVKYKGYCSDLTRTVCMGTPSKAIADIYKCVCEAQQYALSKIKAGITCHEADSFAREYLRANKYGDAFGHTLGHGVGLDIHEFPRVAEHSEVVLLPNMVITVEPGVYVPGTGGVRIEDTVVVTQDGIRNLTTLHKKFQI